MPTPTVEIVDVTPEQAREWLALGTSTERKLTPSRVRRFERILREGRWRLTWDAIAFDVDGKRRNGHHRLKAMANTGVGGQLLVVRNLDPSAVDVGDQGGKRTMRQVLHMRGEDQADVLAPALRLLWQWLNGYPIGARAQEAAPDAAAMLEVLEQHPGLRECCTLGRQLRHDALLGSSGLGAVLAYLFTRADNLDGTVFVEKLCTGVDLVDGDAILQLRHKLLSLHGETARSKGIDVTYKAALTIKAFNQWRSGDTKRLQWQRGGARAETFPTIDAPQHADVTT